MMSVLYAPRPVDATAIAWLIVAVVSALTGIAINVVVCLLVRRWLTSCR